MQQQQFNLRYCALFLAFTSISLGLLVIIGWHFKLDAIIQVTPQVVPMVYNTAVCFILSGLALILINYSNKRLGFASLLALCVFILSALVLSQYVFAINLYIDNLILYPHNLTSQIHPGRMAPNTIIGFLFISFGLFFLSHKKQNKTYLFLSLLSAFFTISFALICLFSYLANTPSLLVWKQFTSMAPNTAIGFLIIGVGMIVTVYNMADRHQIFIQNWSPYLITISALICVLLLWSTLKIQSIYGSDQKADLMANHVREQIEAGLDDRMHELLLLEGHWKYQPQISLEAWKDDVDTMLKTSPKLEAIAWINAEYVIQYFTSSKDAAWLKSNYLQKQQLKVWLEGTRSEKASPRTKAIVFPKGESGLIIAIPSSIENRERSFILGFINFISLLKPILTEELLKNYAFNIYLNDEPLLENKLAIKNSGAVIPMNFSMYDQHWKIETIQLAPAFKTNNQTITHNVIIILGLILSFVLFYTLKNAQIARHRLREIQKIQGFFSRAEQLAQLGGWVWNLENNKIWCSEVALRILGRSHTKPWMSAQDYLDFIPAQDRKQFVHDLQELISNQLSISETQTILRTDNVERTVHLEARITQRKNGKATEVTGIIQDITEKLEIETQLRHAQKMEVLGQLTGGLAHDFNNILMIIRGNIELLQIESSFNTSQHKRISSALSAVERGSELTKHLLGFSRQQSLKPQIVNFYELMPNFIKMIKPTLGEAIEITSKISQNIWPIWVDVTQLQTALLNLALNARDAMHHQGELFFSAENYTSIDTIRSGKTKILPGDYIKISVIDNGEGMKPEVLEHAFEPFFTTKSVGKGSGLGLSMVHGFVSQSKGYVTLHSEVNHGTTVNIYLPKIKSTEQAASLDEKPASEAVPEISAAKTILIVEDEESLREMTVEFFKSIGHNILQAANGPKALEIIENNPQIDLLLSDMIMPGGMTGVDLAIEALKTNANIKILLVTGYAKESLSMTNLPAGFIPEVMVKPYSLIDLQKKVYELLSTPQ